MRVQVPPYETAHGFAPSVGVAAVQVRRGEGANIREVVAAEVPVAFAFNGADHVVMLATPADLEDFAAGFCISEGVVATIDEIAALAIHDAGTGLKVALQIPGARAEALRGRTRHLPGRSGCGLCGISSIEQVLRELPQLPRTPPVGVEAIMTARDSLADRQLLNQATGAVHGAAFAARDGTILLMREDVGRHNALDKLIGALLRGGIDPASGFAFVTSRCSLEMAQKTIAAGIPLLAAISAPTSLAITLAKAAGLTLAAFVREAGFNLYTHPDRVILL